MNGKFVYFTGNAKYDAKKGKYDVLKCFGGVYGKNNNKGSFSGVLYVTIVMIKILQGSVVTSYTNCIGLAVPLDKVIATTSNLRLLVSGPPSTDVISIRPTWVLRAPIAAAVAASL